MGTEQLDETTFYCLMIGLLLFAAIAAICALIWDNKHAMWAGEEPADPLGDIVAMSPEERQRLFRARFERMEGLL